MARTIDIPNEYVISYGVTHPQTAIGNGLYNGQQYRQEGEVGQGFRQSNWRWDVTTGAWKCQPCVGISGSGSPVTNITPDAINQQYLDVGTGNVYWATGITNNDWTLTN